MADNTILSAAIGTGDTIRTDDISGIKFPTSKIVLGADGTDGGFVSSANPLPVNDASGSLTVDAPVGTPVFVRLSDGAAAITALPVTDNSGSLTVDGTVAATQSGTWNVATVTTVTSITNAVAVTDNGSTLSVDDGGGSVTVDNGGTFVVQENGAALTNLNTLAGTVRAEDGASADGNTGIPTLAVRKASPANTSGTDGDYEFLQMSAGRLWCSATIDAALPAGTALIGAVNVSQLAGTTTDTNSGVKSAGTLRVVLATDQPALTNKLLVTPDANSAVNVAQMNGVTVTMGNGVSGTGVQRVTLASDSTGQVALAAGSASVGTVQPGNTANTTPWLTTDTPATSGGLSIAHITAAGSNNKTELKASAGQLYFVNAVNVSATVKYVKVFNKTSANVTAGTTAADYQFAIPANSTTGGGFVINVDKGLAHSTGITVMITGGVSLTDNTSVSANDVVATFGYK